VIANPVEMHHFSHAAITLNGIGHISGCFYCDLKPVAENNRNISNCAQ
jgi:hypothetical protein